MFHQSRKAMLSIRHNTHHSSDENIRLGQFWRGIEEYGAILADLNW